MVRHDPTRRRAPGMRLSPAASIAAGIGCTVDELPALIARMPADSVTVRRRTVLTLRIDGMTLDAIGARLALSRERVRVLERAGVWLLRDVHVDLVGVPKHLRDELGVHHGDDLRHVAPHVTCAQLLAAPGRWPSDLAQFREVVIARRLTLGCGCPRMVCDAWRRHLRARR